MRYFSAYARWSPQSYALRDFLARNQMPYQWIDVETAGQVGDYKTLLQAAGAKASSLPTVLFPDGASLAPPTSHNWLRSSACACIPRSPSTIWLLWAAGRQD